MSKNAITAVLFDLDGTLLDTLDDLTSSVNHALTACGYPAVSKEQCRLTIGHGALRLLCDLAGIPADPHSDQAARLLSLFMDHYSTHSADATAPYPGVPQLLNDLRAQHIKIGVVSNKPDSATKKLCQQYFDGQIDFALGSTPDLPRKPAPEPVLAALTALGADAAHAAYVGDSEPDVQVARNANIALGIAVDWGFRTKEQLCAAGAPLILDEANQVFQAIMQR